MTSKITMLLIESLHMYSAMLRGNIYTTSTLTLISIGVFIKTDTEDANMTTK